MKESQLAKTVGSLFMNDEKVLPRRALMPQKNSKTRLFQDSEIIPTRRVKSISKLFCIEDLIRRGFI